MAKRVRRTKYLIPILAVCAMLLTAVWAGGAGNAFAAGEIGITSARLLAPTGEFLKADPTEGVAYRFWAPLDTEMIAYGTDDALSKMTRVVLEESNRGIAAPFSAGEVGNLFEIRVKTTVTMYVRRYGSAKEEELDSNYLETLSYDGTQYFRNKLDGVSPKLSKNSLLPSLVGNRWNISFSVEDPGSDSNWFWAQSGLKSIKIVKKIYSADAPAEFVGVTDADEKPIGQEFEGASDGKAPVTRTSFSFELTNERGDYYAELTDQVGNSRRVSVLYVAETSNPYFETISKATEYIGDDELNMTLRNNVSNTLDAFLTVLNEKKTGDEFDRAQQPFLKAMRDVLAAYEKGKNVIVTFENKEYLTSTFDAEVGEENFEGKLLYGDTLELRVTFAYFDRKNYKNGQAAALAATPGATGVLRVTVKLIYNGDAVPFAAPVKLYLGIPKSYKNVSAVFVGADGAEAFAAQFGRAWVSLTIEEAGSYDLFFAETDSLVYLWLILLILPIGGIVATAILVGKRRKSRERKSNRVEEVPEGRGAAEDENLSDKTVANLSGAGKSGERETTEEIARDSETAEAADDRHGADTGNDRHGAETGSNSSSAGKSGAGKSGGKNPAGVPTKPAAKAVKRAYPAKKGSGSNAKMR